jgi:RPA family protein
MSRTTVQMSKLSADVPNRDLPLLPGEKVRSYKADEAALPSNYEVVVQAAAEVVGVEFRDVMKVVETYERKLEKVRKARGAKSRSASRGRLSRKVLSKRRSLGSLIAQK